jgi:hypothetical protein
VRLKDSRDAPLSQGQPVAVVDIEEVIEELETGHTAPYEDSMGLEIDPVTEAAAKAQRAQENEWDKIKVKVSQDTRMQVITEFLRAKNMYGELAKFARKRIR